MALTTIARRVLTRTPTPVPSPAPRQRLQELLRVLGPREDLAALTEAELRDALVGVLGDPDDDVTWLTLAVLSGRLPPGEVVVAARRRAQLEGAAGLVDGALATLPTDVELPEVVVVRGRALVDVDHLAHTALGTGIQRVTRETLRRWRVDHDIVPVGWASDDRALRELTVEEIERACGDRPPLPAHLPPPQVHARRVVVPWEATYLLPEVTLATRRTRRMQALADHARSRTGAIGFDTVPLTSSETCALGVPAHFVRELAALRQFDRIATISHAAATEYRGWRTMVAGAGIAGPAVQAVPLAVEVPEVPDADVEEARARFAIPTLPLVLCVGSHEPRKNHGAVLHAAELLWREGHRFSLLFVGGNAWRSEGFTSRLAELRAAGRPVESVRGLSDRMLWALYKLARTTVFPSLNEGFGLPVAESLASGTPVITSDFGSMREIAEHGGAVLVDPRSDADIAAGIARLLTDDVLHARLAEEARATPTRTWDAYASDVWDALTTDTVDG